MVLFMVMAMALFVSICVVRVTGLCNKFV